MIGRPVRDAATAVVDQSRLRHRRKYQALALATRARARHRLRLRETEQDAHTAVRVARALADPAVLLECLSVLLEVDGCDQTLDEARQTARDVLNAVSEHSLRTAFIDSVSSRIAGLQLSPAPVQTGSRVLMVRGGFAAGEARAAAGGPRNTPQSREAVPEPLEP
jgi:hypothetical protein